MQRISEKPLPIYIYVYILGKKTTKITHTKGVNTIDKLCVCTIVCASADDQNLSIIPWDLDYKDLDFN